MATVSEPIPIRDATAEEANVIVQEAVARDLFMKALRDPGSTRTERELAESAWRRCTANREAKFLIRGGWYRVGGRKWGYHKFNSGPLEWGSKPV